jgi:hypothetical protein
LGTARLDFRMGDKRISIASERKPACLRRCNRFWPRLECALSFVFSRLQGFLNVEQFRLEVVAEQGIR